MEALQPPQRQPSLASQLVSTLRAHIAAGGWPVGSRIPAEHTLMEQFQVGRSTLREALGALAHLGLLQPRAGDGTYVRASNELSAVLERRALSAERSDVLGVRSALEEYAADLAAVYRTDAEVELLKGLLGEADRARESHDMDLVAKVDHQFHTAVVAAGKNPLLTEVYDYLGSAVTTALGVLPWDADIAEGHASLHTELVEAIESGDRDGARLAASHIINLTSVHENDASTTTKREPPRA